MSQAGTVRLRETEEMFPCMVGHLAQLWGGSSCAQLRWLVRRWEFHPPVKSQRPPRMARVCPCWPVPSLAHLGWWAAAGPGGRAGRASVRLGVGARGLQAGLGGSGVRSASYKHRAWP